MARLKIVSWNIWGGKHLDQIIDFLKGSNSDVIALQEVVQSGPIGTNTAHQIAEALDCHYVYFNAVTHEREKIEQGNAIVSKLPIEHSEVVFLTGLGLYQQTAETEPRVAVVAAIRGIPLRFITVHLAYSPGFQPSKIRDLQVTSLLKLLSKRRTILMGDFNAHPDSNEVKKVSGVLKQTDPGTFLPTWTVYPFELRGHQETELRHRLDYIFASPDIRVIEFRVETSDGSDHLPVSAVISV